MKKNFLTNISYNCSNISALSTGKTKEEKGVCLLCCEAAALKAQIATMLVLP